MKIVKLVAIFCVLAGGIFLALNFGSLFKTTSSEDFPTEDLIDIKELCNNIRQSWAAASGWDEALYKNQRSDIDQSKGMGMFSREGYNTVNNCLRENAINKACDSYSDALHTQSFNAQKLKNCYAGVKAVKKYEKLDNEPRIRKVEQWHALYTKIRNFVNSRHAISPAFDTETGTWKSFESLQSGILNAATRYRGNTLYVKDMSHIPGFKAGLDEAKLKNVTSSQREMFYETLSNQIVNHFNSVEPSDESIALLDAVYSRFTNETTIGVKNIARLKVNYKKTEEVD